MGKKAGRGLPEEGRLAGTRVVESGEIEKLLGKRCEFWGSCVCKRLTVEGTASDSRAFFF